MHRNESIKFELRMSDGQAVRGVLLATEGPTSREPPPAVIFVHGLGSTRGGEKSTALEAECVRRGWAFASFDFRGHGRSDGTTLEMTGSRLLEDLAAVTRFVNERTGGPVCLCGSSMGGWASAWLTVRFAEHESHCIAACAFVAPAFRFLEFRRLNKAERTAWEQSGRLRVKNEFIDLELGYGLMAEADNFRFDDLAARFTLPAIIFHGLRDNVVPYTVSVEFAAGCAAEEVEVVLLKSGDHRLNREKERLARAACDFFAAQTALGISSHTSLRA